MKFTIFACTQVNKSNKELHILVNNAGVSYMKKYFTSDNVGGIAQVRSFAHVLYKCLVLMPNLEPNALLGVLCLHLVSTKWVRGRQRGRQRERQRMKGRRGKAEGKVARQACAS